MVTKQPVHDKDNASTRKPSQNSHIRKNISSHSNNSKSIGIINQVDKPTKRTVSIHATRRRMQTNTIHKSNVNTNSRRCTNAWSTRRVQTCTLQCNHIQHRRIRKQSNNSSRTINTNINVNISPTMIYYKDLSGTMGKYTHQTTDLNLPNHNMQVYNTPNNRAGSALRPIYYNVHLHALDSIHETKDIKLRHGYNNFLWQNPHVKIAPGDEHTVEYKPNVKGWYTHKPKPGAPPYSAAWTTPEAAVETQNRNIQHPRTTMNWFADQGAVHDEITLNAEDIIIQERFNFLTNFEGEYQTTGLPYTPKAWEGYIVQQILKSNDKVVDLTVECNTTYTSTWEYIEPGHSARPTYLYYPLQGGEHTIQEFGNIVRPLMLATDPTLQDGKVLNRQTSIYSSKKRSTNLIKARYYPYNKNDNARDETMSRVNTGMQNNMLDTAERSTLQLSTTLNSLLFTLYSL
ncbi:PREDICTED: uncharacterized protein LOC106814850, partial [Priapulus caudatus]|uniref:Uncharacterized protein LOC106814850 n=1 Tax=Priapulus caudatus TaxID=37621 RepID=A0ABM1ER80_PRICU